MNRIPIHVDVTITLASPFHVGGGKVGAGTCSYLARDGKGNPYWPGSAFKGKVRHYARLLFEGATEEKCTFEHKKSSDGVTCRRDCLVCDMLGNAGNSKGGLWFSDMILQTASTEMRTGNAIDRYRRTAKDNSLFQIETAAGDVLKGEITGTLSETDLGKQKALLEAAIKAIPHIGGNTGRGLGWVKGIDVSINEIKQTKASPDEKAFDLITLPVIFTAESPLLIGTKNSESNFRATLPYIPGAVVRAALAQTFVAQDGSSEEGKLNWVTPAGGRGQFPSLRKAFGELRITQFLPEDCRFAPFTAVYPKHNSKRSYDTLLEKPKADEPIGRVKGFINTQSELADPPLTMVTTKTAMNRFSGTSQDEMLFSMEVILPPAVFKGTITGNFNPEELERLTANGIRVGGYQTAGYGQCNVTVLSPNNDYDTPDSLRERIGKCKGKIPITLLSDAILKLDPPEDTSNESFLQTYQAALFSDLPGVKLTKAIAQHDQWRGFDTSKRTGFLNELSHVIKAGAVFLLEASELTEELLARLLELQAIGICQDNKHNLNGYGQVRVADKYHFSREDK